MSSDKPLSDNQVHDRLVAAHEALGDSVGQTVRGHTALEAARYMLRLLQLGLIYAAESNSDDLPNVARPERDQDSR